MHDVVANLIVMASMAVTKPAAATSSTDLSPLLLVVIGGFISSLSALFLNSLSNKQQLKRDQEASKQQLARDQAAYTQQLTRDQAAYEQQKEREKITYERSLRVAKRDRLRDAYKIVLLAARTHVSVLNEMEIIREGETEQTRNQRLDTLVGEALLGMDEAMAAITLESVGGGIEAVFREMRSALRGYTLEQYINRVYTMQSFTREDFDREKAKVLQGCDKLTILMQEHLNEFEK